MNQLPSDALVLFGATGDLAHKKIYPVLQALLRRGHLDVPVIGVALSGWNLERLRERVATASNSTETWTSRRAPSLLAAALRRRRLQGQGDLRAPETELGRRKRPLLLPRRFRPACSRPWSRASARPEARTPRGSWSRSLSAATSPRRSELNRSAAPRLRRGRDLPHRPLPRQGAGPEPALLPLRQLVPRADLEPQLRARACRSPWPRTSASRGAAASTKRSARSATWCRTICSTSSPCLAMEPPVGTDSEALRDEKVKVLRSIRPLTGRSRARPVPRLSERGWRGEGFHGRDLRCDAGPSSIRGAGQACLSSSAPANDSGHRHRSDGRAAPSAAECVRRGLAAALQLRPLPTRPRQVSIAIGALSKKPGTTMAGKRSNSMRATPGTTRPAPTSG